MGATISSSAWGRFWHAPVRAERLALMRILLGVALLGQQLLEYLPHLHEFFGPDGVGYAGLHDHAQLRSWQWPMLVFNTDDMRIVYAALGLWMAVTLAFTVGWHTRVANAGVWFLTLSFMARNPLILDGGDSTLQVGIFLLLLSPCGRALSVDAWRRRRRGLKVGPVYTEAWPVRLIQIQLCVIYCTSGLAKWKGEGPFEGTWWDGTSIHNVLNDMMLNRWSYAALPVPLWITAPLTYLCVAWEVFFPLLVVFRPTRKWALLFGILFHLGIWVTVCIGWFSFYMLCFYAVWLPDELWQRWRPLTRADT
jgi:hypothetical protein